MCMHSAHASPQPPYGLSEVVIRAAATPDQMKARMLGTFALKMELARQLLVHQRAVEVTYMELRRARRRAGRGRT
jgi:hypothetical protein